MLLKYVDKSVKFFDYLFNSKKDIEFFGMFGAGNLGDEAMLVAANQSLPKGRILSPKSYPNHPWLDELIQNRRRKFLIVGGGTLIHGGDTGWLDYVEKRQNQGSKIFFLGTGISFLQSEIQNKSKSYCRWKEIIRTSSEVHLRGPYSVEIAQQMGADADIFGDFAFLLYRSDIPVINQKDRSNTIGLNFGNCLGDQDAFEDACVTLTKKLMAQYDLAFYVVTNNDVEATQRIINRSRIPENRYKISKNYLDPTAFMYDVRKHRAFIGLKMHAAGLAMIAGVPAIMIAYKSKSFDFMASLTPSTHMLLDLPLRMDDLTEKAEHLISHSQKFMVIDRISTIVDKQKNTIRRIFP